jgi:hypothetical protein
MERKAEKRKKEWQKPEYRSLSFSQTQSGSAQATYETPSWAHS